jgi:flagellar hook-associated protein 3 FlgL
MTIVTFGDMAQLQTLRRDGAAMKSELSRLTSELSTGRVADLGRAVGGDFSTLADITRALRLNTAFRASVTDAAISAEGRQTSLGRLADELEGLAPGILAVTGAGSQTDLQLKLANGTDRFEQAVNVMNTRLAGRSLFSADAPDQLPLIAGDAMMAELRTLVAGAPDAATIVTDVTAWFMDAGGGYETIAWQGGAGQPPAVLLSEGQSANTGVTALDPAIRSSLAGLAIIALASEQAIVLPESEQRALATSGAQQVQSGETALIGLRARLGAQEARIEEARVTAETTRASLEVEYGRIVEADPYRTATELEAVNTRLETLYLLTARMSRLSLTEFLR